MTPVSGSGCTKTMALIEMRPPGAHELHSILSQGRRVQVVALLGRVGQAVAAVPAAAVRLASTKYKLEG
jgi:hypothetical protein